MNSLSAKVLVALIAGMALGILFAELGSPFWINVAHSIEPIGTLWINAIRMTVIPLVVSAIIVGIAAAPDLRTVGTLGGRAIGLFIALLLAAAFFAVAIAPAALSFLHVDAAAAEALRANAAGAGAVVNEGASRIPSIRQWLIELVPVNPIKAAADGAMLPLIIFALAFGLAASRMQTRQRDSFITLMQAILDASLQLVRWILAAAPIGVFALSLALATRLGTQAASAVIFYIVLACTLLTAFMLLLTLFAWAAGKWRVREFLRFAGPSQAVAFSSRSSLVALPAMVESAERAGLSAPIRSFFLPLAVATFRTGGAVAIPTGAIFLARLYGVELDAGQLITIAVTSVFTTFSVPGIPGGSIIVMVPVLLSVGLPVEGIGLLLGVDTLPDMFRTTTNVTGDMAVAAVLSRNERG